ncbi:MAG: M3 family metallopeptidase, partial [Caulobacteraceae bacterium]
MRRPPLNAAALAALLLAPAAALATPAALPAANPFAAVSNLPFEAPRFDQIKDGDFQPALEAGMAGFKAQAEAIAANPAAPSFDNTLVALEKAGQLLTRTNVLFQNLVSSNTSDILDKVDQQEAPRLQALNDSILLDPRLFARVKSLYDRRESLGLTADQKFLALRYYRRFVHAGAELAPADKAALADLNGQIATLQAKYQTALLAAANAGAVVVADRAQLAGLSEAEIAVAADAAKARKLPGQYCLVLTNTTQQPILA